MSTLSDRGSTTANLPSWDLKCMKNTCRDLLARRLDEYIDRGGTRVRMWEEADEFVGELERLAKMEVEFSPNPLSLWHIC
jgi:hypothetical protein